MFFSVWSETCPVFSYFPYVFSYYFCNVGVVHSHTHTQTHSVAAVVAFACAVPPCGPALFRLFLRVFAFPFVSRNQKSLSSVRLSAMREKPRMPLAAVQRLASAARAFCRGTTLSGLRSQLAQERRSARMAAHARTQSGEQRVPVYSYVLRGRVQRLLRLGCMPRAPSRRRGDRSARGAVAKRHSLSSLAGSFGAEEPERPMRGRTDTACSYDLLQVCAPPDVSLYPLPWTRVDDMERAP